jgi:RNA polymerase sporulation-specific sigma factor
MILGGVFVEEDLILAARAGDDAAFAELCRKYAPLIDAMTSQYGRTLTQNGESREDLRQEASVAFYRALMTFDENQSKVSFGLYAKICIRNRMISLLRHARSEKKKKLPKEEKASNGISPAIDREALQALADRCLTNFEKTVFFRYVDGKSYRDIALSLGVSVKSVDNALFRAKTKLRHEYPLQA